MLQWWDYSRELALDEMLWLEGRGLYVDSACGECLALCPLYCCKDCFGGQLYCQECMVATHRRDPFHIIEVSQSPTLVLPHLKVLHILVLEWQLLRACIPQVSGPLHSAWPLPWSYLH